LINFSIISALKSGITGGFYWTCGFWGKILSTACGDMEEVQDMWYESPYYSGRGEYTG
jgi:hypothetical protein